MSIDKLRGDSLRADRCSGCLASKTGVSVLTWTAYQGGAQKFSAEPFEMGYDSTNHILYSVSWSEGLLALKVQ